MNAKMPECQMLVNLACSACSQSIFCRKLSSLKIANRRPYSRKTATSVQRHDAVCRDAAHLADYLSKTLQVVRQRHAEPLVPLKLLVAGGSSGSGITFASVECFDFETGAWSEGR